MWSSQFLPVFGQSDVDGGLFLFFLHVVRWLYLNIKKKFMHGVGLLVDVNHNHFYRACPTHTDALKKNLFSTACPRLGGGKMWEIFFLSFLIFWGFVENFSLWKQLEMASQKTESSKTSKSGKKKRKKFAANRIRTCESKLIWFQVKRLNHSAIAAASHPLIEVYVTVHWANLQAILMPTWQKQKPVFQTAYASKN